VGFSFSSAGMCIVLAAGCTSGQVTAGRYFIIGRALGLVAIGLAISFIGVLAESAVLIFVLAFGFLSIALGSIMLFEVITGRSFVILESFSSSPVKSIHGTGRLHNHMQEKDRSTKRRKRFFFLGFSRGATPCIKLIVLAPLLIAVTASQQYILTIGMLLTFCATSTIYPIIGFVGLRVLEGYNEYRNALRIIGAVIIIAVGVYVIINHLLGSGGGAI